MASDVVVGRDGASGQLEVAVGEDLAGALEVLVDAHAHELDLEAQLLQLGGEADPEGTFGRCHALIRSGR